MDRKIFFFNIVLILIGLGALAWLYQQNWKLKKRIEMRTKALEEAKDILEIKVQARTRELEELAKSLETQVSERTKQLEEKVKELERFNKLTVGRELRMIELKKEIKKLKEELVKVT